MDSEKESSSTIKAPCMPPPPPPPPMPNIAAINDGRSQLLADIRKGAALKKAPVINDSTELSPSDKLKKQTKDLLHAELTDTLKRRKPVMISEPPKYEYPTYDNSYSNTNHNTNASNNHNNNNNTNKNTSTSRINDSSHSTTAIVNNTTPLNVSAVLSVVTGIKLPDVQYDANASAKNSQNVDKLKISHGKPNFTINQKENKPIASFANTLTSPKIQIKSPEKIPAKLQTPSIFTVDSVANTKANTKPFESKPILNGNGSSIFKIKSQQSLESDSSKSFKSQPKSDVIQKFDSLKSPNTIETAKQTFNKQNSIDESKNGVSYGNVANRKALFEKPTQNENISKSPLKNIQTEKLYLNKSVTSPISNGTIKTFNNYHSQSSSEPKPNVTQITSNKNVSYGSLAQPTFQTMKKDRADHFERSIHTIDETTTTTNSHGKYETKQIEQKTFVSFSKDLLNAPNNYPEQIRVKKTIITQRTHAIPDNPFNNLRFSIKTDGQVIPKPK